MSYSHQILGVSILIVVQVICAVFFIGDVFQDAQLLGGFGNMNLHLFMELTAGIVLLIGIAVETKIIAMMLARQKETEKSMAVARGALQGIIEDYFEGWGLTPAERDVAGFVIKGSSISEIAVMRNAAEGTVKTQLNAVYRKSGVTGRSQLVSLLIEDLMDQPLITP